MDVTVNRNAESATLSVAGEVDLTSAAKLEDAVSELADGSLRRLVIDLSSVSFMDSTGLRVLLKANKLLEGSGGTLVLGEPSEQVRRLLDVSGLNEHFQIT